MLAAANLDRRFEALVKDLAVVVAIAETGPGSGQKSVNVDRIAHRERSLFDPAT